MTFLRLRPGFRVGGRDEFRLVSWGGLGKEHKKLMIKLTFISVNTMLPNMKVAVMYIDVYVAM